MRFIQQTFLILIFALLLGVTDNASAATDFETWTEHLDCGHAHYKLESLCNSSHKNDELNECKSQSLTITANSKSRKIKLPELNTRAARIYKEVGGDINELFVTAWGCTKTRNTYLADFYYSRGGGTGPDADAFAVYNQNGTLLQYRQDPRTSKELIDFEKGLKRIHSIMPDVEEK